VGGKAHSHDSNCIYSVVESNGDSIEFSLPIAEQRAVGFIPAWSLASLHLASVSGANFYREDDRCSTSIEGVGGELFG